MSVADKVIIVTGAASGIGQAISTCLADHGAKVVIADINEKRALEVAGLINLQRGSTIACKVDIGDFVSVKNMIDFTIDNFGKLDVLINNAGIGPRQMARTAEASLEDWEEVIRVNQTGVFYGMKLGLAQMVKQGSGNIINMASLAGLKASGNNISYAASKFAVVGMTKAAALEYAKQNIRVNAICPGYTESPLLDRLLASRSDMEDILKKYIPMDRFGRAEEIAEAALWLASDKSSFVTGQTITLDGGASL